jgi:phosphatidylserine/phosphatidylglycerophosphate/cardiolipin synthase-like enzyme
VIRYPLGSPEKTKVSFRLTDYQPWAKHGPRERASTSGANVVYGPLDGNHILWLRDGARAMFEICNAICKATRFVWITDFALSPGINLARKCSEANYYDMIKQNASSFPDPKIIEKVQQLNSTHGIDKETIPLVSLLETKAQEEHEAGPVKIRVVIFKADWEFQERFVKTGWKGAQKQIHDWNKGLTKNWINLQLAEWGGPLTSGYEAGGHHQKSTIVAIGENLVGFCGGVDLTYARWTPSTHSLSEPLDLIGTVPKSFEIDSQMGAIDPKLPPGILGEWDDKKGRYRDDDDSDSHVFWHDVHAKFVGPAAAQLASNFMDRYDQSDSTPSHWKEQTDFAWFRSKLSILMKSEGDKDLLDSKELYSGQNVEAQIIRSFERYGGKSDWGIWDAYRNLFSKAEKNVFIESQYSFEDETLTNVLLNRIKKNKDLKVIIVAPFMQDSTKLQKDIMKHTRELVQAGVDNNGDPLSKSRVRAYGIATVVDRGGGKVRVPIYVHAKIAVVDDEWSIVGSANLDRMGMGGATSVYRGSSEIAILVNGNDQALALRRMLAEEHLGTSSPPDDFDDLFDSFYQHATTNGEPKGGKPLDGQLVLHAAMWNQPYVSEF